MLNFYSSGVLSSFDLTDSTTRETTLCCRVANTESFSQDGTSLYFECPTNEDGCHKFIVSVDVHTHERTVLAEYGWGTEVIDYAVIGDRLVLVCTNQSEQLAILVFDTRTRTVVDDIAFYGTTVYGVFASEDGSRIALCCHGYVCVINVKTHQIIEEYEDERMTRGCFLTNNTLVVYNEDFTVFVLSEGSVDYTDAVTRGKTIEIRPVPGTQLFIVHSSEGEQSCLRVCDNSLNVLATVPATPKSVFTWSNGSLVVRTKTTVVFYETESFSVTAEFSLPEDCVEDVELMSYTVDDPGLK